MKKSNDTANAGTDKEKRYTTHRIKRSYEYASHDADGNFNGLTVEDWKDQILDEWLPEKLGADHVCISFHDKDKDEEGIEKGLHAHGVVHYRNKDRKTSSAVCKLAKCSRLKDCLPVDNPVDAYRYLIHATEKAINEGKHVYDEDSVIVLTADGVSFDYRKAITRAKEKKDRKRTEDAVSGLLHKVSTGELTIDEVKAQYRGDTENAGFTVQQWHKDRRMYEQAEQEYFQSMQNWYKVNKRCLTGVYIEGEGEAGKSDLAALIAQHNSDKRGYHVAAAPGRSTTYDPVGKYRGEKVSIFNEMEGSNFSVRQFNDMFDPTHASDVNSRNRDKPWLASMFIFTNSVPLEDFITDMVGGTPVGSHMWSDTHVDNKVHQVRRRFAINIVFGKYTKEYYADGRGCYTEEVPYFKIYVRDAHVKCEVTHPAREKPFKLFTTVYPGIAGEEATLNAVDQAVRHYYVSSGYSVTPWTVKQPDLEHFCFKGDTVEESPAPAAWIPPEEE